MKRLGAAVALPASDARELCAVAVIEATPNPASRATSTLKERSLALLIS
jgi:hypothetical protein